MRDDTPAFATGLSLADARARIASIATDHIVGSEMIALESALGRVLAENIAAPFDVPGYINSAMDGYALRGADLAADAETRLRLVGTILAGGTEIPRVEPNTCVRITTGAPLPVGADTVVMKEDSRIEGEMIVIAAGARAGANVRPDAALTPSTSKKSADTRKFCTRSGSPVALRSRHCIAREEIERRLELRKPPGLPRAQ